MQIIFGKDSTNLLLLKLCIHKRVDTFPARPLGVCKFFLGLVCAFDPLLSTTIKMRMLN